MIDNRFQLKELLGNGSFASVHKARDKTTKRSVAIKLIEKKDQKLTSSEVSILAKLSGKEHFPKLI